jgi:hypothetical protein
MYFVGDTEMAMSDDHHFQVTYQDIGARLVTRQYEKAVLKSYIPTTGRRRSLTIGAHCTAHKFHSLPAEQSCHYVSKVFHTLITCLSIFGPFPGDG